jgi:hypothetical protein
MSSPKSPAKSPKSPQSPPGAVEAAEAPAAQARDGFIQPVSSDLFCSSTALLMYSFRILILTLRILCRKMHALTPG